MKNTYNAKEIWQAFNKKHTRDDWQKDKEARVLCNKVSDTFKEKIATEEKKILPSVIILQCFFRDIQTKRKDRPVKINLDGNHSKEFLHVMNNQPVTRLSNFSKLQALEYAINKGDMRSEIFNDPHMHSLAISLFDAERITKIQFATVFEYLQLKQAFKSIDLTYYSILDEKGNFSEAASKKLLSAIQDPHFAMCLAHDNVEIFRLLLQELPKSEQIFFVLPKPKVEKGLYNALFYSNKIIPHIKEEETLIYLTCGARDALGLAQFGPEACVGADHRLGKLKTSDIEASLEWNERPIGIYFPGVTICPDVHDFIKESPWLLTLHDELHRAYMSGLGQKLIQASLILKNALSSYTKFKNSTEKWLITDIFNHEDVFSQTAIGEYNWLKKYNFEKNNYEWVKSGELKFLIRFILEDNQTPGFLEDEKNQSILMNKYPATNLLEFIFFIELTENASQWKNLNITVDIFDDKEIVRYGDCDYKERYDYFKKVYKKEDNFLISWLKYSIATYEHSNFKKKQYLDVLNNNKDEILKNITIAKKQLDATYSNALVLTYQDEQIFSYNSWMTGNKLATHSRFFKTWLAPNQQIKLDPNPWLVEKKSYKKNALTINVQRVMLYCGQIESVEIMFKQKDNVKDDFIFLCNNNPEPVIYLPNFVLSDEKLTELQQHLHESDILNLEIFDQAFKETVVKIADFFEPQDINKKMGLCK